MAKQKGIIPSAKPSAEFSVIPPGIHKVKIKEIKEYVDKDGLPKYDKLGHPGLTITFRSGKKDENGKFPTISDNYYYYNPDIDTDGNRPCKSEWKLGNLRKAMGFKPDDVITEEEALKKTFYIQVKRIDFVSPEEFGDKDATVHRSYSDLTHRYWPGDANIKDIIIPGDPAHNDGKASGEFQEFKAASPFQLSKWGIGISDSDDNTSDSNSSSEEEEEVF